MKQKKSSQANESKTITIDEAFNIINEIHKSDEIIDQSINLIFYRSNVTENKPQSFRQAKLTKAPDEIIKDMKNDNDASSPNKNKGKKKNKQRNDGENENSADDYEKSDSNDEENDYNEKPSKERRAPVKWTEEEIEFLFNGYRKYANSWTQILKEYPMNPIRMRFDLKDKWKNMVRKSSDPNYKQVFEDVNKSIEQRNQNLSKATFFLLGHDPHSKSLENDESFGEVQRVKNRIKEIFPKRFHQQFYNLFEDDEKRKAILEEWPKVEKDISKAYEFLNHFLKT